MQQNNAPQECCETPAPETTVFEYIRHQAERIKATGRMRTGETYRQALANFMRFRDNEDLHFDSLSSDLMEQYEGYMRANGLSRNTTSFYMRILRSLYNRAVEERLVTQTFPFRHVYTGVDKTAKRAITLRNIRNIIALDLSHDPALDYSRDMFLMSFYMRGMSFIDMAYLRKQDLSDGYIAYVRKKTGQRLTIRWEPPMQKILDKYPAPSTPYLLPIITDPEAEERGQYLSRLLLINRKLKHIARLARIPIPLTSYVSRHSWASIANAGNVPLNVISEAMGHDNEATTCIYLSAIQSHLVDEANKRILNKL